MDINKEQLDHPMSGQFLVPESFHKNLEITKDCKLVMCLATKTALIFGPPVENFRKNLEIVKDNNNSHVRP